MLVLSILLSSKRDLTVTDPQLLKPEAARLGPVHFAMNLQDRRAPSRQTTAFVHLVRDLGTLTLVLPP